MKQHSLLLPLFCVLALCSCGKESNPLQKHDPKEVATFLFENGGIILGTCGKVWAKPKQANSTVIKNCEEAAFSVATLLKKEGYGEITSENAKLKTIWIEFNRIAEEKNKNRKPEKLYDAAKAREAMRLK